MSEQLEMLDAVVDKIDGLGLFASVNIGQLNDGESIAAELDAGHVTSDYFDRGSLRTLPLFLLCKHKSQQTAMNTLFVISNYLSTRTEYPRGENWQITTIRAVNAPTFVKKEQSGGYFIYSAIANIEYCLGGVS